jgi:PadR family transcriptional regulator AphA
VEPKVNLTSTSYLVLGMVGHLGSCTSYDMKRVVGYSIGYFWTFPHSQLYAEPARLAGAGLLTERQEAGGRRRRTYSLTRAGRQALDHWLAETRTEGGTEIRDLGLLKLFFGAQAGTEVIGRLAEAEGALHGRRLVVYEEIGRDARGAGADAHQLATLDMGLRFERAAVAFWRALAADPGREHQPTRPTPRRSSQ